MPDKLSPNPKSKTTMAQKASVVYYSLAIAGAIYCIYFTSWGGKAYTGISYAFLIYGFFASIYFLIKVAVLRYRDRHPHAAKPMPHPLAPSVVGSELAPAAKTPFFHDDPSRLGKSGIGMPALINFGARTTILITLFFVVAAGVVHYLSAQPSRQEALQMTGFLCAVALYLGLLVRYAIHAFRWIQRHVAHAPPPREATL